jgi:hypothetical protein
VTVELIRDPATLPPLDPSVTVGCRDWDCYWRTTDGYVVVCHRHHSTAIDGVRCLARWDATDAGWAFLGIHPAPRWLRALAEAG